MWACDVLTPRAACAQLHHSAMQCQQRMTVQWVVLCSVPRAKQAPYRTGKRVRSWIETTQTHVMSMIMYRDEVDRGSKWCSSTDLCTGWISAEMTTEDKMIYCTKPQMHHTCCQ